MTELEKALEQLQGFLEEADYEEAEDLMTMSDEELDELFRRFKRDVRKKERAYSPNSEEYKSLNEQRALVERIEKMLRDREKENSGLMIAGTAEVDDTDDSEMNESELAEKIQDDIGSKTNYYYELLIMERDEEASEELYKQAEELAEKNPAYNWLLEELDRIRLVYEKMIEEEEGELDEEAKFDYEEKVEETTGYRISPEQEEENRKRRELIAELDRLYDSYVNAQKDKMGLGYTIKRKEIYKQVAERAKTDGAYMNLLANIENASQSSPRRVVGLLEQASQMGNGAAAMNLSVLYQQGKLIPKDITKARKYLDLAVKRDSARAIRKKALELGLSDESEFGYLKDREAAFFLMRRYIELSTPLDIEKHEDREALYFYYLWGARTGHDMEKEAVAESWKSLLEVEGSYTQKAKRLPSIILQGQGRYDEAVQLLLDQGTESAMEDIEEIFFSEYFTSRPQEQQDLENYLIQMRESDDTIPEVREELYEWYGWRYEVGKDTIKDTAIAYAYYGKAAAMGGWDKYKNYRNRILRNMNDNEKIVFFKNVMKQGYYDVAKEIAELYESKYQYEDAQIFYLEGSERAVDRTVKGQCREGYTRCKERLDKRQAQIEAATPSYHQCNTGLIGQKKDGFLRLRGMATLGNTYAALRFAQIAEQDKYLKDNMENFPSNAEIFMCYKHAAEAGEPEAISRMVDIFEYGQLGQSKNTSTAERWRKMR